MTNEFIINRGNKKLNVDMDILKKEGLNVQPQDFSMNSIFSLYDIDGKEGLSKKELKKLQIDLKTAAGDDEVLTEEEGNLFLYNKIGAEKFKKIGTNAYNKFIEWLGNQQHAIKGGQESNGNTFIRTKESETYKDNYKNGVSEFYDEDNRLLSKTVSPNEKYTYKYEKDKTLTYKNGNLIKEEIKNDKNEIKTIEYGGNCGENIVTTRADGTKDYSYDSGKVFGLEVMDFPIHKADLDKYINSNNSNDDYMFDRMGGKAISIIKNSDLDNQTKNEYIKSLINKAIDIADTQKVYSDELKLIKNKIDTQGIQNVKQEDMVNAYNIVLKRSQKLDELEMNGKVDKEIRQGKLSDCWYLSAINGLANNSITSKILNDSIRVGKNGDVEVTFKGVNKTFTVARDDLKNYKGSTGDNDVKVLEIAAQKYIDKFGKINGESSIKDGGYESDAYYFITGNRGVKYEGKISDKIIDEFNSKNTIYSVSCKGEFDGYNAYQTNNGEKYSIYKEHAFNVQSADKDNVYLMDSNNGEIVVPRNIFKKYFNRIFELNVNNL